MTKEKKHKRQKERKPKELNKKLNIRKSKQGIAKVLPSMNVWNKLNIRTKIMVAFAVPILFLAVFGFVAYQKASSAIIENYENSTITTLNATKDYITMELNSVLDESYNLISYESVRDYYKSGSLKEKDSYMKMANELSAAKTSNSVNYNIHVFGDNGDSYSTAGKLPKDFYQNFNKSEEGKMIQSSSQRFIWLGKHPFLDDALRNTQTAYSATIIRKLTENNGYIVIDVLTSKIVRPISQLNLGKDSIVGFITSDGQEALYGTTATNVFKDLPYYKSTTKRIGENGSSFEKYNKKDYLFLYSKVDKTGATICALVPKSEILKKVNDIRTLVILFVILACVFVSIIGTILARGIGIEITKLSGSIMKAAGGDLTTKFETKRKDEFLILSQSLKGMMGEMRSLIKEVANVGTRVTKSADELSGASTNILDSTKNISLAIDEIGNGVTQQASDTEQCSNMMSDLSDQINLVYKSTYEIEQIAKDTTAIIGEGIVIVDVLNSKSSATTEITHVVINEIEDLELHSRNIQNIIHAINDIAAQTNLLSLNASIEAARAGDAGKGFAVVAEEIRKLADQSSLASNQIKEIVDEIQEKTKVTAHSAKQAKNIVETQMEALGKAITTFENINLYVEKLVSNLNNISEGVKTIESAKDRSMDAITNISAVSEETASASEEVSATAIEQINSVEFLSRSADELAEEAKVLEKAILMFKFEDEE